MKSSPITQRAATKYGSALPTQEVTVDAAGTTPAKFEKMTPLKQLAPTEDDTDPTITEGNDVFGDHGLGESAGWFMGPSADFNKNPFAHRDGSSKPSEPAQPEREKVKTATEGIDLIQGARDLGKSKNQSVSIDTESDKPKGVEGSIASGQTGTSDDGDFVGPYERRQRMRAVRISERQAKRGAIKEARINEKLKGVKEGTVKYARLSAKLEKAKQIKAEAERMRGSNVNNYETNFGGSGPEAPEIKTVKKNNVTFSSEKAANSSAGAQAQLAKSMKPVNMNTKPADLRKTTAAGREKVSVADTGLSSSTPDAFRQARGINPLEEKQTGISKKNASSPIYKMGGYGSKTYK